MVDVYKNRTHVAGNIKTPEETMRRNAAAKAARETPI
jgi:hypothetical protein